MKKFVSLFFVVVLCFSLSVPVSSAKTCKYSKTEDLLAYGYCNATNVNVRTGPGTNYTSIAKANKGDKYWFYQTNTKDECYDWSHVHSVYGDIIGWMYSQYYTATEAASIVEVA